MADQGNSRPRPPLEQSFDKVGTFTTLANGTIVPDPPQQTSKEEDLSKRS